MVPIVQKQVSKVLIIISRRWTVNYNTAEDAVPSLDIEVAMVPATSVLSGLPLVCKRITCQM